MICFILHRNVSTVACVLSTASILKIWKLTMVSPKVLFFSFFRLAEFLMIYYCRLKIDYFLRDGDVNHVIVITFYLNCYMIEWCIQGRYHARIFK